MRTRPKDRIDDIADGALACFSRAGVKRTQMADVARHVGIAPGTLYLYVESKEALLHLAFLQATERDLSDLELPLRTPPLADTVRIIEDAAQQHADWPRLVRGLKKRTRPTREELVAIGEELYDLMHRLRRAIRLMDNCSPDVPELDAVHARSMRGRLRADLETLASKGAGKGAGKSPLTPAEIRIIAQGALQVLAWGAMHRRNETAPHRDRSVSEPEARHATALAFAGTMETAYG